MKIMFKNLLIIIYFNFIILIYETQEMISYSWQVTK